MAKKIIVAGGGHGGIACAAKLAEKGFDVTVYEKNKRKDMGYDWTDIFDVRAFDAVGIPAPEKDKQLPMHSMSFTPPSEETILRHTDDDERNEFDIKMERREIYNILISFAEEKGVKFVYETEITAPVMAGDRVIGIKTSKGEILGDLVIDACGVNSPVRKNLPECCLVQAEPKKYEVFYTYRAFYNLGCDVNKVFDRYKVYMIPNGQLGIGWVAAEDDFSDLLIGEFEPFTAEEAEKKAEFFRNGNPVLGDELKRGGQMTVIPVRQTIAVMVADGYAAIGDSAFMTIPIIGSGIANSIKAAAILADVVASDKTETYSAETLWDYQLRYYNEIGAGLASLALVKLLMTKLEPSQLDYMFDSKIITINELTISGEPGGGIIDINPDLIKKGAAMVKDKRLVALFASLGANIARLSSVCKQIPKHYSRYEIAQWAKKYDDIFKA